MFFSRVALTAAVLLAAPLGSAESCYVPTEEVPDSVDSEPCSDSAPVEGCVCAPEGALGCTDDGLVHEEGFICSEGLWHDAYGTASADDAYCHHPDLAYNYCAYVEGQVLANCTLK